MGQMDVAWKTTVQYMKDSSIAGLSHAAKSRSYGRGVYWLIIFTAGFALTGRSLYVLVDDFFRHPVVTSSYLTTKPAVTFPAVTICNMNRIHCLNMESYLYYKLSVPLKEDNFASEAEKARTTRLHNQLEDMSINTGCRAQACDILGNSLGKRENSDYDDRIFIMHELNCIDHFQEKKLKQLMCYYLHTMTEYDDELTTSIKKLSASAYNASSCDVEEVCSYLSNEDMDIEDEEDPQIGEMILVECDQYGSSAAEEKRRRKRRKKRETKKAALAAYDESSFMLKYMELPENIRRILGHQMTMHEDVFMADSLKGFFIHCDYGKSDCNDKKYWYRSSMPNYGNCFTFNAVYNEDDTESPRSSALTGALNGLTVELFVDQLNYMKGELSQKAGIRLIIHNPDSYPMPDEFGQDIMPGTASSVALQMNDITRLPEPHPSDCFDFWNQTSIDKSLMNPIRPRYAKTDCTRFCLQHEIMKKCDCFHTQYDMTLMNVTKFNYTSGVERPCATANEGKDRDCVNDVRNSYDQETTCPSCQAACNETEYSNYVTTSLWPSNRYWTDFALELGFEEELVFDSYSNAKLKQEIQQNYLKVSVYFQTLNVREITQTAKYTGDSMLAAVGGALSLFLGVAIILLFEVIELSLDIVMNVTGRRNKMAVRGRKMSKTDDASLSL